MVTRRLGFVSSKPESSIYNGGLDAQLYDELENTAADNRNLNVPLEAENEYSLPTDDCQPVDEGGLYSEPSYCNTKMDGKMKSLERAPSPTAELVAQCEPDHVYYVVSIKEVS
jgi:hypothetical protein